MVATKCSYSEWCIFRFNKSTRIFDGFDKVRSLQCSEKIFDSDEYLTTHIQEIHPEKNAAEIEFDLYVETNLPELFDLYLTNNRHVKCYFCDFESKSQILKNISDEVSDHVEEQHEEVSATFDPNSYKFKNDMHREFLEFVGIITEQS